MPRRSFEARLTAEYGSDRSMDTFDEESETQDLEHDDDAERLEVTDIASDEEMDGDVDADGGSAISRRNE
jgi:hypothetical protein